MLTGLNHITIAVSNLQRSFDFYKDALQFSPRARWENGAYLELGDLWLCLSFDITRTAGQRADYTHYAFSVAPDNFPALVESLRKQGVKEWKSNTSEGDSFYFLDPDGHKLEVHVGCLGSRLAACREKPYRNMEFY